eukprot:scaffold6718_cov138-Isochrysis_galbana.AAC.1
MTRVLLLTAEWFYSVHRNCQHSCTYHVLRPTVHCTPPSQQPLIGAEAIMWLLAVAVGLGPYKAAEHCSGGEANPQTRAELADASVIVAREQSLQEPARDCRVQYRAEKEECDGEDAAEPARQPLIPGAPCEPPQAEKWGGGLAEQQHA